MDTDRNRSEFTVTLVGDSQPVLRQNENGPCFVIALVNAILLSDAQNRYSDPDIPFKTALLEAAIAKPKRKVSLDTIYSFLVEKLISDEHSVSIPAPSTREIMDILPLLDSGLLINPSLDHIEVSDFGDYSSPILNILQLFKLRLYHAFIMPSDLLIKMKVKIQLKPTFDTCQDYLVSHIDDDPPDELSRLINEFLENNKTEMSENGYQLLLESLQNDEIFLFFRNDHFNTCIKHDGVIYSLVTDIGYLNQPDIVWLPLSINDEGDFHNAYFEKSKIHTSDENETAAQSAELIEGHSNTQQDDADRLLAQQLQLQEDEQISKNLQERFNKEQKVSTNSNPTSANTKVKKTRNATSDQKTKKPLKKTNQNTSKLKSNSKSNSKSKESCVIT